MSKRTLILAAVAVVLIAAAFFSLFLEKQKVETELDDLLNGQENETIPGSGESSTESDDAGKETV